MDSAVMGPPSVSHTDRKGSYAFGKVNYTISTKKKKKISSADTEISQLFSVCLFIVIFCQMTLPIHKDEFWGCLVPSSTTSTTELRPSLLKEPSATAPTWAIRKFTLDSLSTNTHLDIKKPAAWLLYSTAKRKLPCFSPFSRISPLFNAGGIQENIKEQ